jgi:hypothetical protein
LVNNGAVAWARVRGRDEAGAQEMIESCNSVSTGGICARTGVRAALSVLRATVSPGLRAGLLGLAVLALAACNGTAVVTLTSTPSQNDFLAYRVSLVSVDLQQSGGTTAAGLSVLPASTTVDLASLTNLTEVVGSAALSKGTYTSAVVTLDYTSAQIVYDDGSVDGVALTPVDSNGKAVTQVKLTVTLDPSDNFSVVQRGASQLALDLDLGASNAVNLSAKTVTVTPVIAASAAPIDSKLIRIRGPLIGLSSGTSTTATGGGVFTMNIIPFNATSGTGSLGITTSDTTAFEVNGGVSVGGTGLSALGTLGRGAMTIAYGTLTSSNDVLTTTTDGVTTATAEPNAFGSTASTPGDLVFTASQVLGGTSVQGGLDRISGVVSGRSGNTFAIQDGTLLAIDGTETFLQGTTVVGMGSGTAVTTLGQSSTEFGSIQEVTVGSVVDAFGTVTDVSSDNAALDASAGRVRIGTSTAAGLVTATGTGVLEINLLQLDGRAPGAFDFTDSGAATNPYVIDTADLDLTNATTGVPVMASGVPNAFGVSPPNFTAGSLLDPTTISALLVIDWGSAGTSTPFSALDTTEMDINVHNTGIGTRHAITVGPQVIDMLGMSTDPVVGPDASSTTFLFAIGHAVSGTVESFNTYTAFASQLQTELASARALTLTAAGIYSSPSLAATSVTIVLNN